MPIIFYFITSIFVKAGGDAHYRDLFCHTPKQQIENLFTICFLARDAVAAAWSLSAQLRLLGCQANVASQDDRHRIGTLAQMGRQVAVKNSA